MAGKEYDNTNKGAIFRNNRKTTDKNTTLGYINKEI